MGQPGKLPRLKEKYTHVTEKKKAYCMKLPENEVEIFKKINPEIKLQDFLRYCLSIAAKEQDFAIKIKIKNQVITERGKI